MLAVAADSELIAADAIEKIAHRLGATAVQRRPARLAAAGSANARDAKATSGRRARRHRTVSRRLPQVKEVKWTDAGLCRNGRRARCRWARRPTSGPIGDVEAGFKNAALVLDETFVDAEHQPSDARNAHGDGVLAERQGVHPLLDAERQCRPWTSVARWLHIEPKDVVVDQRVHRRRVRQQGRPARSPASFRRCCRRRPTRR